MPFLKNDERIPMWQAQYQQIIQTLKTEDVQRMGTPELPMDLCRPHVSMHIYMDRQGQECLA
jgi:hypothetical protein